MKQSPNRPIPLLIFACLAMCAGSHAHGAGLRSPWDSSPVTATETPYRCPAVVPLPVDFVTNGFYADNDPTHSIIDPVKAAAYAKSAGGVKHDGDVVVAAADAYRKTGSLAAARCVIEHIEANARNRSLTGKMSSN
jgi:poly(beta-D-mannuronate) lyase